MDVFTAVRTVRAVRAYEDRPVSPDVVHRVLEAAHLTASSRNGQPWHFIVVEGRDALSALANHTPTGVYTKDAAFAVVVAVDHDSPYGVSDASRAIQSMVLVAWEQGVGSNWVGFNNLDSLKAMLGIPAGIDVVAVVPFGYPVEARAKGKKQRKPFGEVVYRGRFGEPFA